MDDHRESFEISVVCQKIWPDSVVIIDCFGVCKKIEGRVRPFLSRRGIDHLEVIARGGQNKAESRGIEMEQQKLRDSQYILITR